jgi:hypothetical protein
MNSTRSSALWLLPIPGSSRSRWCRTIRLFRGEDSRIVTGPSSMGRISGATSL